MPVQRRTMKFLVPVSAESLGRNDVLGRSVIPLYINPTTIRITNSKLMNESNTKGGYIVQYWGEQYTNISVTGQVGSGGIEAINILRDVYRNEIIQFTNILRNRAANNSQEFISAFEGRTIGNGVSLNNFLSDTTSVLDSFTGGGASDILNGVSSIIEQVTDAAAGIVNNNPAAIELSPTLGAYATSVIMYWHGERYQGIFKDFNFDEGAETTGNFTYTFTFHAFKRSGSRSNFMPWHRNPYDANNEPRSASMPVEGPREDELTFPVSESYRRQDSQANSNDSGVSSSQSITSRFSNTQESTNLEINNVGISRNRFTRGS
jgi:hypothetical protein